MSKILLDGFDIAGLQAVYGIGVAQIVKTEACQTDTGHDFLEVHIQSLVVDVAAKFVGKNKIAGIIPE